MGRSGLRGKVSRDWDKTAKFLALGHEEVVECIKAFLKEEVVQVFQPV